MTRFGYVMTTYFAMLAIGSGGRTATSSVVWRRPTGRNA